jgi:hypothetical protein
MTDRDRDPMRWKDQTGSARDPEQMLGHLVRSMGQPPSMSEPQLSRIASHLHPRPHRQTLLRWLPAALVILFASSVVMAAHMGWGPRWLRLGPPAPQPTQKSASRHSGRGSHTPSRVASEVRMAQEPQVENNILPVPPQNESSVVTDEAIEPSHRPAPAKHELAPRRAVAAGLQPQPRKELALLDTPKTEPPLLENKPSDVAPKATSKAMPVSTQPAAPGNVLPPKVTSETLPSSAPSTVPVKPLPPKAAIQDEGPDGSRWLAEAIHSLRQDHAPELALGILDKHAQELSRGGMSHETTLVRVEALLKLHRTAEVLRLLDAAPLADAKAARSLLLTRAELRATAGRCADGLGDFDLVLTRARQPDERALYGRAVCRQRTGNVAGARRDFEQYQQKFPQGPHLREVRTQLAGLPSP